MKVKLVPIGKVPIFDLVEFDRVVENALEETAQAIYADYQVTMQTWTKRAEFVIKPGPGYSRDIYTENEIYGYVSGGTRPHTIRAKNAPVLAFQGGYKAKTTPQKIKSGAGGPFGPTVFAVEVDHPGTEARNFEEVIGNKWDKQWPKQLDRAIAAGMRRFWR